MARRTIAFERAALDLIVIVVLPAFVVGAAEKARRKRRRIENRNGNSKLLNGLQQMRPSSVEPMMRSYGN